MASKIICLVGFHYSDFFIIFALQVGDGVWKTWAYNRYLFQQQREEEIGEDNMLFQRNEALGLVPIGL